MTGLTGSLAGRAVCGRVRLGKSRRSAVVRMSFSWPSGLRSIKREPMVSGSIPAAGICYLLMLSFCSPAATGHVISANQGASWYGRAIVGVMPRPVGQSGPSSRLRGKVTVSLPPTDLQLSSVARSEPPCAVQSCRFFCGQKELPCAAAASPGPLPGSCTPTASSVARGSLPFHGSAFRS